jgi:hypothetical protein
MEKGSISRVVSMVIFVVGILGGILFLSPNLTGYAIGALSMPTTSVVGGVLFIIGFVAGFFWLKRWKM